MKRSMRSALVLVLAFVAASVVAEWAALRVDNTPCVAAAQIFLARLSPAQKQAAQLPFEDAERFNWHFVPRARKGLSLKEMTDEQRRAAHGLLRSGLSSQGYLKTTGIISLETILRELESRPGREATYRDPGLYWMTIFGEPGPDAPWGWRFEGHHVSLNFTGVTNELVASTPAFLGANPAHVQSGPQAGLRVLGVEEDLGRKLLASMTPGQREEVILSDRAPRDIIMGPGRTEMPPPEGITARTLRSEQRRMLDTLILEYVANFRADLSQAWMQRIDQEMDEVRFAWAGSAEPGQPHYYRIQGPSFIIEYDNVQNDANHVHTVWRDVDDDFGRDLLREHHDQDH